MARRDSRGGRLDQRRTPDGGVSLEQLHQQLTDAVAKIETGAHWRVSLSIQLSGGVALMLRVFRFRPIGTIPIPRAVPMNATAQPVLAVAEGTELVRCACEGMGEWNSILRRVG